MNELQQAELRALREEQRALRQQLGALDERLAHFERQALGETERSAPAAVPPPLPSMAATAQESVLSSLSMVGAADDQRAQAMEEIPVPPSRHESLEMRIGTTWLVRAGVVLMLTAFAFLGTFLYQNVVPHLGATGKVALLYLGAFALTAAGAFLERSRQARDNLLLRNYAGVVFAGGLAAVYYVTYAAHYFENLRVVPNAIVAGAMLLAWTAFMVLLAHRRNSETLATVAILLAYYTAAINEGVAAFTLFSTLALTAGSGFLLRRHLWRVFPFASVLATFGSYAFWTYYHSLLGWRWWEEPPVRAVHGGFWIEAAFLTVYWVLFTWVVFTAADSVLPALRRAGFASLNNGAFFALMTWLVLGEGTGWFWKWSLGFGAMLLALAEACQRLQRLEDDRTQSAYRFQGVALVSVGLIAYFDGWQLSLVLAVQAAALLLASAHRREGGLLVGSAVAALLAFWWAVQSSVGHGPGGPWLTPLAVGGVFVGTGYLAQRLQERTRTDAPTPEGSFHRQLGPLPAYFALLGSSVWWLLIGDLGVSDTVRLLLLIGAALALTASVYGLRIRALPVYAQAFAVTAFLIWLMNEGAETQPGRWLTTFSVLGGLFVLGQWWRRLPGPSGWSSGRFSGVVSAADAILAVLGAWHELTWRAEAWRGGSSFAVTAGWSILAAVVFTAGLLLRERVYRWLGLLIIGVTLGRIVLNDILALDSLGKAISIFALAAVLLGVGFLYNKYQDKFRDLL